MEREESWLAVVGTGPGGPEYLTPAARQVAEQAKFLIGGAKALALFADAGAETYRLSGDLSALATYLKRIQGQPAAVLVSGDPGFFSLLPWLKKQFPGEKIQVVPGISSLQMAFARLTATWEQATFISLHGRDLALLQAVMPELRQGRMKLALLTGGRNSPAAVGQYLRDNGLAGYPIWVGAALGTAEERCLTLSASVLAGQDLPDAVLVLGYE